MKRKNEFVLQDVGGESLLIPVGSQVMEINGIITLNETGCYLWELLAEDCSLDELAEAVAERFDVTRAVAKVDVHHFTDEIADMGLLEL
jgi:hypothetical protein